MVGLVASKSAIPSNTALVHKAPSCAPTDLNMTLSSRSLQLSWSTPPSSCLNGLLTTFLVQVTEIATGKVIQNTSTDDYLEVTSLHPYYTYECVVAAATVVGPGPFSVAMSGRTNEDGTLRWEGWS